MVYKSSAVAKMGDRGHKNMGLKRGLLCPFCRRGAGSPSNTKSHGPTSISSGIVVHPAI